MKEFTVVMRGESAVVMKAGENFLVNGFPSEIGPVNIMYSTRWICKENGIKVPGNIWIEIKGKGDVLEDVLVPFANAGLALLPIISLSANAAISDPDIEIGFDSTPNLNEREYFQQYLAPEAGVLNFARELDTKRTIELIDKFKINSESERIFRAANQYRLALDAWGLGKATLSLAHLWMALEALTKARVRLECLKKGINTEQELAKHLNVDLKELDSTVRRDIILKGDIDCYKKAKDASNGFEHGYLGLVKIHNLSTDTRHRMARYIRTEIFEQLDIDDNKLSISPFDKPLGLWPVVKYVRGKLIGEGKELARDGSAYPFLNWGYKINKWSVNENGEMNIKISDNFTPELAKGIKIKVDSYEVWKPE